jgi:hypothetical protein
MSLASQKKRHQLRKDWLKLVGAERDVSFQAYKERLGILPAIQKGWSPDNDTQAPHQQGRVNE